MPEDDKKVEPVELQIDGQFVFFDGGIFQERGLVHFIIEVLFHENLSEFLQDIFRFHGIEGNEFLGDEFSLSFISN